MNVMVYNKYKDLLMGLNIEVMKALDGVYNVDEIIDTFTNFYYDKMIIDITAIRDYQNTDNLQKLAMNINMENVIFLLDDNPEIYSKAYLSKLVSLGIYNFTKNADGINYLMVHPHTYKDVVNIHNIQELDMPAAQQNAQAAVGVAGAAVASAAPSISSNNIFVQTNEQRVEDIPAKGESRLRIVGIKNVTAHAGATSLIYMLKKTLASSRDVVCIEVNKVDFLYFNDNEMVSTTTPDLLKEIMHRNNADIIFVDLNDYEDTDICTEVYYLIEPSTIMINKMMKKNKGILEKLRDEKVILNKCILSSGDIATFEYETKLRVLAAIPPLDDRQDNFDDLKKFVNKVNL